MNNELINNITNSKEFRALANEMMSKGLSREQVVNSTLSAIVLEVQQTGKSLPESWDFVFGAGAYRKLANDVWEKLNGAAA